jgi:DNA-directed RNA polymerase specialized sigma24 family protein
VIWPGGGVRTTPHDFESAEMVDAKTGTERVDLDSEVQAALSQLPELHRMAVTLRYFEELDYATIEQTLGLTNGALRGILGRALGVMRRRLKPALAPIA